METEIEQLNFFDLNVEIAKPFVDVSVVFLFNIFELICRKVDVSVQIQSKGIRRLILGRLSNRQRISRSVSLICKYT